MTARLLLIGLLLAITSIASAQSDYDYPRDEYLGGGIGYTPMFLLLDVAKAFPFSATGSADGTNDLLGSAGLGFTDDELADLGTMMVIHGAEGFGNISGHWRMGAYVGLGSNAITRVNDTTNVTTDLKVTLMTGSASLEYVIPVFSNLELAAGSLFGLSRAILQFANTTTSPSWDKQFAMSDSSNSTAALSGTFFMFQPYIAIKLQILDRAGLRMSGGYNIGTLAANRWTLNDFQKVLANGETSLAAPAIRVMLYMGI